MFHSTFCITSRHRQCADAACRCHCHDRTDGTNRGPSNPKVVTFTPQTPQTTQTVMPSNFWKTWNADAAKRRLQRAGVVLDTDEAECVGAADAARLAEATHECMECNKPMTVEDKDFKVCDECFEKHYHYATPEERKARRGL